MQFPSRLVDLWEATLHISDKLVGWMSAAVQFVWRWFLFAFEKFVDLMQWIAQLL